MPRPRQRPIFVAHVLGWVGFRALMSAGVLTALLVVAVHPAAPIWIGGWVLLTLLIGAIDMRQSFPRWFDWFRGRPPEPPRAN
ncbi:MAG TPA: hypothetical protein VHY83_04935 [Solirubrobacteraceae bacterium]|jgi:hypothetical protein|nr:hypothetical protein [Solirubrobacteraceae bacterium]